MALNASRVSPQTTPGVAAAATARTVSGGRNVAHSNQSPVESTSFLGGMGVTDGNLFRYEEEGDFDLGHKQKRQHHATPFIFHNASAFKVDEVLESMEDTEIFSAFLSDIVHGVSVYERNLVASRPNSVRCGSVMNYLF